MVDLFAIVFEIGAIAMENGMWNKRECHGEEMRGSVKKQDMITFRGNWFLSAYTGVAVSNWNPTCLFVKDFLRQYLSDAFFAFTGAWMVTLKWK